MKRMHETSARDVESSLWLDGSVRSQLFSGHRPDATPRYARLLQRALKIQLATVAVLVAALMLAGCAAPPQRNSKGEFPVYRTAAVNWPANLTLEQLKDEPIKQLDGGISMSKEGVANATNVVTWREFEQLTKAGYEPASGYDLGMAGWFSSERASSHSGNELCRQNKVTSGHCR